MTKEPIYTIAANMLSGDDSVYVLYDINENPVYIDAIIANDGHPMAIHFYFESSDDADINTIEELSIIGIAKAITEFIEL